MAAWLGTQRPFQLMCRRTPWALFYKKESLHCSRRPTCVCACARPFAMRFRPRASHAVFEAERVDGPLRAVFPALFVWLSSPWCWPAGRAPRRAFPSRLRPCRQRPGARAWTRDWGRSRQGATGEGPQLLMTIPPQPYPLDPQLQSPGPRLEVARSVPSTARASVRRWARSSATA